MAATYLNNTINYNRVYLAIAVSVVVHILLVLFLLNKESNLIFIENGVRAFDSPRISISISKMPEPKKNVPKPEKAKPVPIKTPIVKEEIIPKVTINEPVKEVAEEEKIQEAIPVIENATFNGQRTPPIYPKRALMLKQEGVVVLQALIDTNGNIKDVKLATSSGYAILDKSATDAVWKWKFEPSVIDGTPSVSWVKVPVEFMIK